MGNKCNKHKKLNFSNINFVIFLLENNKMADIKYILYLFFIINLIVMIFLSVLHWCLLKSLTIFFILQSNKIFDDENGYTIDR